MRWRQERAQGRRHVIGTLWQGAPDSRVRYLQLVKMKLHLLESSIVALTYDQGDLGVCLPIALCPDSSDLCLYLLNPTT